MARKDHLITVQTDSKLSKKFLSRNNAIVFQSQVPTIAQQINGIGAASKTPDEIKDTKFPVLGPINGIGKNISDILGIDLSLENSPFHCIELSDVGATVATLTVNLTNLVKNKAEKFILDITKDVANTIDPNMIFSPIIENLPLGFPFDQARYLLEVVARETPTETRFEVVNTGGTSGVSFPLTPDVKVHGNVTGAVTIDLALITAHYHTMTLIGNITFTFSNPPINNREISFILDITQDATGGRVVTWPPSVRVDPTVGSDANARTVIIVTTVDNGVNYDALIVTGGEVNAANKQLSNLSSPVLNTDLDFGTFDIFNVDIIQFALGGASLLSTDVGFDANVNGGITTNILTDVGGNWKVTEEGSTRLIYDTANNAFQVQDVNPLISLQETGTSTAFTISKIAGRTDISEPTEIQFQIAVTNIFEVLSTGITMADNKFIANVDQIGFRITGNFIEDDASGLRLITVPTDFVMMGDGTNTFMTVQDTHFDIGGRYWQLNAIASPGVTGSATLGRVFIDSGNSNHLSIIRNGAIIDLEAGGGTNEFVDDVFRIIGSVDDTSKLAFEVDGIATGITRTWTAQNASGTVALLDGAVTQITINNWDFQGNVILGNTTADTISCLGLFDRDILSDVAGRNIGGVGNEWLSIFLSGNVYLGTTTTQRIFADATGMEFHVPTADTFEWKINAITEMEMTNTGAIDHKGNLVFNASAYEFGSGARRIQETGSDVEYNVGTGGVHNFEINNVDILNIGLSTVDFIQGSIDLQDATESFVQYREILNPATPIAARARQFLGVAGGKQELRIKWDDGVVTVIATQP